MNKISVQNTGTSIAPSRPPSGQKSASPVSSTRTAQNAKKNLAKTVTYERKNDHFKTRSRARQRSVAKALAILDSVKGLDPDKRLGAIQRTRQSKQPVVEAKRAVNLCRRNTINIGDQISFADDQQLRVKIIRRHHMLDTPQASMCNRVDRIIATTGLSVDDFARYADITLSMDRALPKSVRENWGRS